MAREAATKSRAKAEQRNKPAASDPGSELRFLTSPDEYARIARSQKAWFLDIADRLERGEPLTKFDAKAAAGAVRVFAAQIPEKEPRTKGRPKAFDHAAVACKYVLLTFVRGMGKTKAKELLAEENDVSVEAIKGALKAFEEPARRWTMDVMGKHLRGRPRGD